MKISYNNQETEAVTITLTPAEACYICHDIECLRIVGKLSHGIIKNLREEIIKTLDSVAIHMHDHPIPIEKIEQDIKRPREDE